MTTAPMTTAPMTTAPMTTALTAPVGASPLAGPVWRRIRLAVAAVAVLIFGAYLVTQLKGGAGRPLDPGSAAPDGARALATLMRGYGVHVTTSTTLSNAAGADETIVLADPSAYTAAQLDGLSGRRVVLPGVTPAVLRTALERAGLPDPLASTARTTSSGPTEPDCTWPGAVAAGTVELPTATIGYLARADRAVASCYGGAVVVAGEGWVALGSADLLRNDHLGNQGVAALAVNAITDDGRVRAVEFVLPGADATAVAAPTTWALFPSGARRAFVALAVLGLVLVLWRVRRLGPVVAEPLPVVVRSAELVEGHGRLYRRAGARVRAAAALRDAARHRLGRHLGLPSTVSAALVATAVATRTGRDAAAVAAVLDGPPPPDDASLVRLADELDALATASGVPPAKEGEAST